MTVLDRFIDLWNKTPQAERMKVTGHLATLINKMANMQAELNEEPSAEYGAWYIARGLLWAALKPED